MHVPWPNSSAWQGAETSYAFTVSFLSRAICTLFATSCASTCSSTRQREYAPTRFALYGKFQAWPTGWARVRARHSSPA